MYIQSCGSYDSCIFVGTIPIFYEVPWIVASAPQALNPLSHVAGNRIRENPDNFSISTYYRPSSGGTRAGVVIQKNSGAA